MARECAMAATAVKTDSASRRRSFPDRFSVLLIAFAAILWVSDAYFRNPLTSHLSASQIVVMEDALVTLILLPFLIRGFGELRGLTGSRWLGVLIIGVGPQAIATWLFTKSFAHHVFAVTYVAQQTQPLIAIALAWIILGERRRPWFWPLAAVGMLGVYLVVFASNPDPRAVVQGIQLAGAADTRLVAGLEALGAAVLWAAGTVFGRFVLRDLSFQTTTALRFTVALPVLVAIVLIEGGLSGFTHYQVSDFVPNFLYIAIVPGVIGLLIYYRGLVSTPASLATIAELTLPVAIQLLTLLPYPWGFGQKFYFPAQVIGTALLLAAIVSLNWTKERRPPVVVAPEEALGAA
jgi:drug/metabolite transporter (DMT)-like permease